MQGEGVDCEGLHVISADLGEMGKVYVVCLPPYIDC